ncbi:ClbS/DfsB family four-helix bundle protein [Yoonia sp. I 8.24]|uniref:ClbS/DfsB family four-helix bundle protein n=1 Tax=Yoonia sp. I 8.24 TaxID=1537229 RepID=UPI001EDD78A2|nr:ClbS/DfsB family four-helix bundle protein [Yoonia sp. I 8.24]MCG3267864.1 ClbS/DfsB family four-helix bundle protein [Yoonia sp. I 8.24]
MAATTKSALLEISQKEFAKLSKLVDAIDTNMAMTKGVEDTSIKDVISHRAHWISLFLGWYADGQAEKPVFFPAEGYKWNDLKRYNADLRQRQSDLDWDGAKSALASGYADLIACITSKSEAELFGGPMKGANNKWTPGRCAEAAGPSHFRSAAKFLRAEIRSREL